MWLFYMNAIIDCNTNNIFKTSISFVHKNVLLLAITTLETYIKSVTDYKFYLKWIGMSIEHFSSTDDS